MVRKSEPHGSDPWAPVNGLASCQSRHTHSRQTSYDTSTRKVKQPRRAHYPNLSPTRAPSVASDVALWPAWTEVSVEDLDLDGFDDDGFPLRGEGGWLS